MIESSMYKSGRMYVAGHRGLVGSAIRRRLQRGGYPNLTVRDRSQLDLFDKPVLDGSGLSRLGWRARIGLEEGIAETYDWFSAQEHGALHSVAT
jgi:nucleoside-diphosphate-sugar epimerase